MNDLMTKSFLSYVDLKKQATKDLESDPDIETGQLGPPDDGNLSQFFVEVEAIKSEMEDIANLQLDLQTLTEETKSTAQSAKILRGVNDRINSDTTALLRKARTIKAKLESLDKSNVENRGLSPLYVKGSHVDRTRISVTNGLRIKLKEMMENFQCLREKIVEEHKQGLKTRYYTATGETPSDEVVDKMVSGGGPTSVFAQGESVEENRQRDEAVMEIQRSLVLLHQVFLDMAVMVECQGEQMNNIEQNVVTARDFIGGGVKELDRADTMKKRRRVWACWIVVVVLVFLLVCLVAILF
ncbi:hypothetical protein ABFS82_14G114600 [Erythranthe guttata]|uniref:syntaxin-112-like n=1 Tax=Erythranthe guttata TaxID=4155 RepID=UPI00064DFF4E|nr:PREDICTED: syntaxin-112-like [Erythranthe guttata]|eukprot:XP_012831015.1 PREDICTED: syntaxin-112-like [Erythranthe guttata]